MDFNPDSPYGKGAILITPDNIKMAIAARAAEQRIKRGQGTPQDFDLVQGRRDFEKKVREGRR